MIESDLRLPNLKSYQCKNQCLQPGELLISLSNQMTDSMMGVVVVDARENCVRIARSARFRLDVRTWSPGRFFDYFDDLNIIGGNFKVSNCLRQVYCDKLMPLH